MAAATLKFEEATGKMKHICRKIVHSNTTIRWRILDKVTVFRHFCRLLWDRILIYSSRISPSPSPSRTRYRKLSSSRRHDTSAIESAGNTTTISDGYDSDDDSDLVSLKISLLGDCQIGKTTFLIKYIGDEQEKAGLEMKGLNLMDKVMNIHGAKIAFKIWDVAGDSASFDQVPLACKDAVAILFMFDLTSRCTLNSIIGWYSEARKWNQNAIPILIGTKFDDFAKLPPDIQWTVVTQARAYARAMKATLFFSSATHNINVSKIFKFIMAKLFNLPWTVRRNLTIGEPIIDY